MPRIFAGFCSEFLNMLPPVAPIRFRVMFLLGMLQVIKGRVLAQASQQLWAVITKGASDRRNDNFATSGPGGGTAGNGRSHTGT
jgi:hypothetical protein